MKSVKLSLGLFLVTFVLIIPTAAQAKASDDCGPWNWHGGYTRDATPFDASVDAVTLQIANNLDVPITLTIPRKDWLKLEFIDSYTPGCQIADEVGQQSFSTITLAPGQVHEAPLWINTSYWSAMFTLNSTICNANGSGCKTFSSRYAVWPSATSGSGYIWVTNPDKWVSSAQYRHDYTVDGKRGRIKYESFQSSGNKGKSYERKVNMFYEYR